MYTSKWAYITRFSQARQERRPEIFELLICLTPSDSLPSVCFESRTAMELSEASLTILRAEKLENILKNQLKKT